MSDATLQVADGQLQSLLMRLADDTPIIREDMYIALTQHKDDFKGLNERPVISIGDTFALAQSMATRWKETTGSCTALLRKWTTDLNRLCDLLHVPESATEKTTADEEERTNQRDHRELLDLDAVVTESALCPRVDVLPDVFHPSVALYGDLFPPTTHLSLYASTILFEFCQHRDRMRRFSFIHLLRDVDVHAVLLLDDALYRRIICDHRLSFLAEGHSPKIHAYKGSAWVSMWDEYLGHTAECVKEEHEQVFSTVLSALCRRERGNLENPYYMANNNMTELPKLDTSFQEWVKKRELGELWLQQHAQDGFRLRAWPICLLPLARALLPPSSQPNDMGAELDMQTLRTTTERWYAGPATKHHEDAFRKRYDDVQMALGRFTASTRLPTPPTETDEMEVLDDGTYRRGLARRIQRLHKEPSDPHPMGDSGLRVSFLFP